MPWIVFLVALAAGCGPSARRDPPADVGKITPLGEKPAAVKTGPVLKEEARPAILQFIKEADKQKEARIEFLSEPMEPDWQHADAFNLHGGGTAYYVVYSLANEKADR